MKTVPASTKRLSRKATQVPGSRATPGDLKIRNILVPIDFSEPSLEAVEAALPLVKEFGAELHLIHVFEPDYPLASMAAIPLIVPELQVGRRVRRHLKDVAKKHSVALRRGNVHATKGRPFAEICRLARDREIDLIVMATRGNTGLKHLALGSTAERVIRYAPCPVLIVRPVSRKRKQKRNGEFGLSKISFHKILVPTDFSDCSQKGLDYAKSLAKRFGSKLTLINSVALNYYVTNDEYARYDFPLLMQQASRAAREEMRELIAKTDWEGIKVKRSLQIGHAGQQICARADAEAADVIVTSTHGRTGLKHALLGSTAEYVVRHAPCPVLVVPSHERPAFTQTAAGK
jgi:nucleotide-binding universal stress UspA family protein